MATESVPDPAVVDSVDLSVPVPDPEDCVPPCEEPRSVADLSPGWVALTDRELLVYHPDREPPVGRTLRANVTGVTVRRAGARQLLGYVPMALLYALVGVVVGLLLVVVDPTGFLAVPEGSPVGAFETVVRTLEWATNLLGAVLAFTGVLSGLGAVAVVGYWLGSSDVTLVVERGGGEELACPTTLPAGRRAVRSLRAAFD